METRRVFKGSKFAINAKEVNYNVPVNWGMPAFSPVNTRDGDVITIIIEKS